MSKKNDYDSEPVEYCTNCLSLRIVDEGRLVLCDDCGCTDTAVTDIKTWEKMYEKMYDKKFLDKK